MPVERGAAPALLPRKQRSGRSWVTVLANYVAAPLSGLVGTGGSEGESRAIPRWKVHPFGPESYGPGSKIAAVERRVASVRVQRTPRRKA